MSSVTSPTSQESRLWKQILSNIKQVSINKESTDFLSGKVTKVHSKLESYFKSKESNISSAAAFRLRELYKNITAALENESRMLEETLKNIKVLIEMQEENDQAIRKRKSDENRGNPAKRAKSESSPQFYIGTQVAAKVGSDWILAVVVNGNEEKGKIEIEDIEDDEDEPGKKKRYHVSSKFIIPIVKTATKNEFPTGSRVMALFPAASCFYEALVVLSPSAAESPNPGMYVVQFDDDQGFERCINPSMILKLPDP